MSGSGGDRGYDYQADGYAFVSAHGLAGQPLAWFDDKTDIPASILMETGGAGDDLQIATFGGKIIELQAKHAFKKGEDLFKTLRKMVRAVNEDEKLRAVIMVDRHSSKTITEDLRQDILRLGQGRRDDLKIITTEVLSDLSSNGIDKDKAFERIRIVVVNLDEASDGVSAACAMLGQVVNAADTLTAYKLLGKRGHLLMKNRGRDAIHRVAEQLDNEIGVRSDAKSPIAAVLRYRQWVNETTGEFYSPTIGKRFPIAQAWSDVESFDAKDESDTTARSGRKALAKEISRYQEWYRLADRFGSKRSQEAITYAHFNKRTVIIGGPGAGKLRLESPIPLVAIEAGSALVDVARLATDIVGPLGSPLWDHTQTWTQLAGRAISLAAGESYVEISAVAAMLSEFQAESRFLFRTRNQYKSRGEYDLQCKMLPYAVQRVVSELDAEQAEPLLKELFESKNLSVHMMERVSPIVQAAGFNHLLFQGGDWGFTDEQREKMKSADARMRRANIVFLECVLKATQTKRRAESVDPEDCLSLAALLTAIKFWETSLPDWQVLSLELPLDSIVEVVRGAIAAMDLSQNSLGREANAILDRQQRGESLISMNVPNLDVDPDWSKAASESLNPMMLAAALHVPCWPLAVTAAELLSVGVGGEQAKDLVKGVLDTGHDRALHLAGAVVREIFNLDAFDVLNQRLSNDLTVGCGYLFPYLIDSASTEQFETAIDRAMEGLTSDLASVATGAAEMLQGVAGSQLMLRIDQLSDSMNRWKDFASKCERCDAEVKSGSCTSCNIVAPTPRVALLSILSGLDKLSVDELVELSRDSWRDVAKAACDAIATQVNTGQITMAAILYQVNHQEADIHILDSILALPTAVLEKEQGQLLQLLESKRTDVRSRIISALSSGWVGNKVAAAKARLGLNDPEPSVRNVATQVLRNVSDL